MDDVLFLISTAVENDEYGVPQKTEVKRQVFCKVNSVTRGEFFSAGRNGLNASLVFSVADVDYNGEILLEYNGQRYAIYRTYRANSIKSVGVNLGSHQELQLDYVELYVELKGGTN